MKHYIGICLILLTLTAIVLGTMYGCAALADRTVNHVVDAFAQVLQVRPQVTVNQRVVFTQTAPIAELAVVTKQEMVTLESVEDYEFLSHIVPLTQKKLTAQAVFQVKAGFDLREPFSVEVDPQTHAVRATLPPAKILSVEQVGDLSLQGEDGLLNKITDAERTELLNDLHTAAVTQAQNSGLTNDAENQVRQRLEEIFRHNGEKIDLQWQAAPAALQPRS